MFCWAKWLEMGFEVFEGFERLIFSAANVSTKFPAGSKVSENKAFMAGQPGPPM